MCEHSICDGLSLSNAAHELLQILSDETGHACEQPLPWAETMENAIRNSLPFMRRMIVLSRFLISTIYTHVSNKLPIARVPFADVDFDLNEMEKYCHTEAAYGVLSKEMTTKLLARCRQEGVTVTAAGVSAILLATASLVPAKEDQDTIMTLSLGADTRRRCVPPVPNHDLSYHVSGLGTYGLPTSAAPKTPAELWQLAQTVGQHMKACVDAGQVLGCGMIAAKIYERLLGPINLAHLPTYGISSWGVLPFVEQYGPWQLTGMTPFINLTRGGLPFTIIQTVNGVLTMMFGGTCPLVPASVTANLRDRCMDALQQMIDN